MIKNISSKNILVTPFVATKKWTLYNTINDDLILLSSGDFVSYDYVNYLVNPPLPNRDCNIALTYNSSNDAIYQKGNSGSGIFYPDVDSKNKDGTYKRLVYNEIHKMFYNNYHNPTQIFGMDNIDFYLGNTNRIIGNEFLLFNIPQNIMGDKIVRGSISIYDLQLDDNAKIIDDANGNLIIGNNLFSKIQETRHISNLIIDEPFTELCTPPLAVPLPPSDLTTSVTSSIEPYFVNLNWVDNSTTETGFYVWRSVQTDSTSSWTSYVNIASLNSDVTHYQDTINTTIISASYKLTAFNYVGESQFSNIAEFAIYQYPTWTELWENSSGSYWENLTQVEW